MHQWILHIPVLTTLFAAVFTVVLFRHCQRRNWAPHLAWWTAGVFLYGVGTFTEGFTTLFGWSPGIFRAWYISGALLGGFPLAQGTVYLLMKRKTANILSGVMVPLILIAATCALLSPLNTGAAELQRLSGKVFEWQWVRAFSPFINLYAFFFLAGGAVYSAWHYRQAPALQHRYTGNIFIAIGAILPGIGGTFTRMGYMEVLYVTELMGLLLIYIGYRYNVANPLREPHSSINTSAA